MGWLKTIAGFANASGGDFYTGVKDKTNKLIGFDMSVKSNNTQYDILTSDVKHDASKFTKDLRNYYRVMGNKFLN